MQTKTILENLSHSHSFDDSNQRAKRNTLYATVLTFVMMIAEITAGIIYNSMALLADGWHMSSHALALGLSQWLQNIKMIYDLVLELLK